MSIRCGFHGRDVVRHDTIAQVRDCAARHYETDLDREDALDEQRAEQATERHYENQGFEQARLQEQIEAAQGVIPFRDAMTDAAGGIGEGGPDDNVPQPAPLDRFAHWRTIPVGTRDSMFYALPGEDGPVKFYRVDRPSTGQYANRTYLHTQAGPAFHPLRGKGAAAVLDQIADDPRAAAERYGAESGNRSRCNTPLTDPESLERKLGPVCASKLGW